MNPIFRSCRMLALGLALFGCAVSGHRSGVTSECAARNLFNRALADCKRAKCEPVAAVSLYHSTYWLPESVGPLLKEGASAMSVLTAFSRSRNVPKRQLASVCIQLMEGEDLTQENRQKDEKSGITLVKYTVNRYKTKEEQK